MAEHQHLKLSRSVQTTLPASGRRNAALDAISP
jgi:hypothetical protein